MFVWSDLIDDIMPPEGHVVVKDVVFALMKFNP